MNARLLAISLLFPSLLAATLSAQTGEGVSDDDVSLAGNPIIIKSRLRIGDEHTDATDGGTREKLVLSGVYGFGFNGRDQNFGIGFELPTLFNNPEVGDSDAGLGDFKLRFGQLFIDDPKSWRAGWFSEVEFDTADDDVEAIANQRTQAAIGGGGTYSVLPWLTLSSTVQYGWSFDNGETTGRKAEWEGHFTLITKLSPCFSASLDYKGVLNTVNGSQYFNTLEPAIGWTVGTKRNIGLSASLEIPLEETGTDWIAKAGLTWFF